MSGRYRNLVGWALLGLAGAAVVAWAFPWAYPFLPAEWSTNRQEAVAIALERFRDLGPPVEDPYVVASLDDDSYLERRLQLTETPVAKTALAGSELGRRVLSWMVHVYPPGALPGEWTYRARIAPDGEVLALELRVPPEQAAPELDPAAGRALADEILHAAGFDLSRFGEPELRRTDRQARTDFAFRYRDREAALGPEVPYGIEVVFAGDVLTGFVPWIEDPDEAALQASLQTTALAGQLRILMPYLLFPFVAVPFLRRYHAGEVGARRGVHIFLLLFACGAALMLLSAKGAIEGANFGPFSRRQVTWVYGGQIVILWFAAISATAALAWAAGEARCRERWGAKLAAFDALFHGRFANATVARSALRGPAAGLGLAALLLLLLLALEGLGVQPLATGLFGPWWEDGPWPGLALLAFLLIYVTFSELFARLFVLPWAVFRLGKLAGGALVVGLSALFFFPPVLTLPGGSDLIFGAVAAAALVAVFLACDLLTLLLAALTLNAVFSCLPFLLADDAFLQLQGALPLAVLALPLVLSARDLLSGKEFVYRWEDVPQHVRRIAERERQRVELETARGIQTSILPKLPPRLNGVDLAHAYLPATEVGGDFYDVLALEDGRLALAVGDVAGHGVSSGLVMSMTKSALAVQVTFNPDVDAVFRTLNRTVYQAARKRLLTTLCYALLDPQRRELLYASAGHLFPYVVRADGAVHSLESVAYPLGVRDDLEVHPRAERLAPGDTLFLFSDGVVEARPEGSDEVFGFERLEESLERHAGESPERLRDGVLADVERFTGRGPREDDRTILVARLPE